MGKEMISLKDAMQELKISAQGLDNHIKNKNMKKHYEGRRAFIAVEDFEIIKKSVELNGRVHKIKQQDNKDLELLKRKEELESEKVQLESQLKEFELKFKSALDIITNLKEDKETYKDLLDKANTNNNTLQKLLDQEQQLRAKDVVLIDNLKGQVLMLTEAKSKNDELKREKELLEINFNSALSEKEIAITRVSQLEQELVEARKSKEIVIKENNELKNMKFKDRLKFLLKL